MIEYGFLVLKLHRIYAMHFSRNPASGRVMEKCGMVHEAHLREHGQKWGVFEDVDVWDPPRRVAAAAHRVGDPGVPLNRPVQ